MLDSNFTVVLFIVLAMYLIQMSYPKSNRQYLLLYVFSVALHCCSLRCLGYCKLESDWMSSDG